MSHLPAAGGKWTSVHYLYKCNIPVTWQVSTSDICLSNTWGLSRKYPSILNILRTGCVALM